MHLGCCAAASTAASLSLSVLLLLKARRLPLGRDPHWRTVPCAQSAWQLRQHHILARIQSTQHIRGDAHPGLGFWAVQVGGMVVSFVPHLGAAVDVEAHVVVLQLWHTPGGLLHPLNLLQRTELARGQVGKLAIPEQVHRRKAARQDVHHSHSHELAINPVLHVEAAIATEVRDRGPWRAAAAAPCCRRGWGGLGWRQRRVNEEVAVALARHLFRIIPMLLHLIL
mmetsp:Transcript_8525/g.22819  ORF Transcript_8525/g.22819 Transcript_8525/m.22819 type:complete len:225 (-) Transcript_8525:63-737(-)